MPTRISMGAPGSHQRTWAENDGEALPQLLLYRQKKHSKKVFFGPGTPVRTWAPIEIVLAVWLY
jgi:hypothetical protein